MLLLLDGTEDRIAADNYSAKSRVPDRLNHPLGKMRSTLNEEESP
jgi:hypothetical protein